MPTNHDAATEPLAAMLADQELIDPRTLPVRFSRLKRMAQSPAHYLHSCQRSFDSDESVALRLGSGTHALVLGQPVIQFDARRYGKAWDAFKAEHAEKVILSPSEMREAQAMAGAITRNRAAMALLFAPGAVIEREIKWRYNGRECSSRPDTWTPHAVTDLKTARTSEPAAFTREALRFGYHAQLAAYREAIQHETGCAPDHAFIVAVEKDPPHAVTTFEVSPRALDQGLRLWAQWFERLQVCEAINQWPEYAEAPVLLDVPEDPLTTWEAA